jgi:hypothetical protein
MVIDELIGVDLLGAVCCVCLAPSFRGETELDELRFYRLRLDGKDEYSDRICDECLAEFLKLPPRDGG